MASLPAATAPDSGRRISNLHRLIQSQGAYQLADSRVRPAGVEPACRTWEARPDRSARDASTDRQQCGIGDSNPGRLVGSQESCRWTNPACHRRAEGEGVEPSRLIARPSSNRVPSPIGLPFRQSSSSGGRNRTCVPPVNSRALVPARTPPESHSDSRDGRIRTGDLLLPRQAD